MACWSVSVQALHHPNHKHSSVLPTCAGLLSTVSGGGWSCCSELCRFSRLHRLWGQLGREDRPGLLVVVGDEDRRCALLVDELMGQQQVVAKSLTKAVGKSRVFPVEPFLGPQVGLILDTGSHSSGQTSPRPLQVRRAVRLYSCLVNLGSLPSS